MCQINASVMCSSDELNIHIQDNKKTIAMRSYDERTTSTWCGTEVGEETMHHTLSLLLMLLLFGIIYHGFLVVVVSSPHQSPSCGY